MLFACPACRALRTRPESLPCPTCHTWLAGVPFVAPPPPLRPWVPPDPLQDGVPRIGRERVPPSPVYRSGLTGVDALLSADGGVHQGGVILLSGRAGSGKSVLLTQMARGLAKLNRRPVLYGAGEEGKAQVIRRGKRLGLGWNDNVAFVALDDGADDLNVVLAKADRIRAMALFCDSVQAMRVNPDGRIGSAAETLAVAEALVKWAKSRGAIVFIVCHQNKAGGAAGPETIVHLVDTEAYYLGEPVQEERVFSVGKNREGPPGQIVLKMTAQGLVECPELDPMAVLAEARRIAQGRGREEDDEDEAKPRRKPKAPKKTGASDAQEPKP